MDFYLIFMIWMGVCLVLVFAGLFVGLNADKEWRTQAQYYPVSPLKFIVMSLVTLDLYFLFWFLKNWRFIAARDNTSMSPLLRTVFSVFYFYPLMKNIRDHTPESNKMPIIFMVLLIIIYIVLSVWNSLYFRIDYPIPAMAAFVSQFGLITITLPVVLKINQLNETPEKIVSTFADTPIEKNSRFGPLAIAGVIFGGTFAVWILATESNYLPTDKLYPADMLWQKDKEFVENIAFVQEDEYLIYFFSTGLFSIEEDGNILTSEKILSYYEDEAGEVYTDYAFFTEITEAKVDYADTWADFTVLEITWGHTDYFYLYLTGVKSEDRKFINKFKELSGVNVHPEELD